MSYTPEQKWGRCKKKYDTRWTMAYVELLSRVKHLDGFYILSKVDKKLEHFSTFLVLDRTESDLFNFEGMRMQVTCIDPSAT